MIHLLRLNIVTIYCRQFPVFNTEMHNRFKSHFSCLLGPIHESEGDIEVREMGIHEKKTAPICNRFGIWGRPVSYIFRKLLLGTTFPSHIHCLYLEPFKSNTASKLTYFRSRYRNSTYLELSIPLGVPSIPLGGTA